ncbi:gliding motility-associated-like protein [Pontibacter aydingkolensis]|uniref:Gliding motility-associated C-terminal domain-containing protein n=1 Tax=Pontibacter aydingkolensis TaxID=1911536 RepID=A0ABS7CVM5_9BACT|nr:gliding motility-associated C-terminal domain-containing protein [Pontibacter aydingkolensis]MBW7467916.1 gliding motility-associated C-terminal domain-containing protein [Pontibacter aydingkolensis]
MKFLLTIWLLLLATVSWSQTGCFQAIQDGQVVDVICANKPVFFRDCAPPDPNTVIFYYPGPEKFSIQTNVLTGEQPTEYKTPGTYIVTQIINKKDGGLTQFFEKTYTVKAADTTPEFTATACANNAVSMTITDDTYDSYTINFGDGTSQAAQPKATVTHNYTTSGTFTITVSGTFTGSTCSATSTKQITTLPPFKLPYLQNLAITQQGTAGEVWLDIRDLQPGYLYIIERWQDPRTNFQKIDTIRNVTQNSISHTLRNVNTAEGVWYLVRITDECSSVTGISNSNIISSIALEVAPGNEQASLKWQAFPGASQYEIYRNNTRITTLNSNTFTFTDEDLSCGQTYTYFIKGVGPDGSTSTSAAQSIRATSTVIPNAPYVLASFNLNNQVELSINLPQNKLAQKIDIQRSINGAAYQNLASVTQPQYTDAIPSLNPICYRATFTDPCNNTSPVSNIACPIILTAKRDGEGSVQLSWTPYTGFPGGVWQYTVEVLDAGGALLTSYAATGTTYTDRVLSNEVQLLRYRIKASSNQGTEVTYSNIEQIEQDLQLYIPSAFTPNGDGLNDVLEIKGRFIQTYTLKVYNSLGNVVFQSDGNTNWDGTYQGKQLPAGAYAYEVTVKTNFGTTKRRTGTVTLLR